MSIYLEGLFKLALLALGAFLYGLSVLAVVLLCFFVGYCLFSRIPPREAWQRIRKFVKDNYQ